MQGCCYLVNSTDIDVKKRIIHAIVGSLQVDPVDIGILFFRQEEHIRRAVFADVPRPRHDLAVTARRQVPHRKLELHVVINVIDTGISLRPLEKPDKRIDCLSGGGWRIICNTQCLVGAAGHIRQELKVDICALVFILFFNIARVLTFLRYPISLHPLGGQVGHIHGLGQPQGVGVVILAAALEHEPLGVGETDRRGQLAVGVVGGRNSANHHNAQRHAAKNHFIIIVCRACQRSRIVASV